MNRGSCSFEATHGSTQFYELRAALTRLLIETRGFQAVVVEGDWPDAQRTCRYVSGRSLHDTSAEAALGDFGRRFPRWLWRNQPTAAFVEWLKRHNEAAAEAGDASLPVGFYGMDLYSLHHSAQRVVEYLEKVDPPFAAQAREAYAVFEPYARDPFAYGKAAARGPLRVGNRTLNGAMIQKQLESVLTKLQSNNVRACHSNRRRPWRVTHAPRGAHSTPVLAGEEV